MGEDGRWFTQLSEWMRVFGVFVCACADSAPSRENPIRRNWLHWAVVNVPGPNDMSKGHTIVPYMVSSTRAQARQRERRQQQ